MPLTLHLLLFDYIVGAEKKLVLPFWQSLPKSLFGKAKWLLLLEIALINHNKASREGSSETENGRTNCSQLGSRAHEVDSPK
jgi:hypothetical protein